MKKNIICKTKTFLIAFILVSVFFTSQAQTLKTETQIAWDAWGVPHITANTVEELFFAQGWAQMHNHANLILEMYGINLTKCYRYFMMQHI